MKRAGAKEGRNGATRRKGVKIFPINRKRLPPIFSHHLPPFLSLYRLPPPPAIVGRQSPSPIAVANRRSSPPTFFSYATRVSSYSPFSLDLSSFDKSGGDSCHIYALVCFHIDQPTWYKYIYVVKMLCSTKWWKVVFSNFKTHRFINFILTKIELVHLDILL
jgi:hypothetical protein